MKDFLISTDTTADLPASYVKENNIDIHTLFYAFGEVIYGTDNKTGRVVNTLPVLHVYYLDSPIKKSATVPGPECVPIVGHI